VKITVGTGEQQKEFSIHYDIICHKAPEFDKILKDDSPIGHKESLDLPKDYAVAFEMFMGWLYRGIIEEPSDSPAEVEKVLLVLKNLVAFTEKYNISDLADLSMDSLVKFYLKNGETPYSGAASAYRHTQTGSRLRKFYTKSLVCSWLTYKNCEKRDNICDILKTHEDILPDFLAELKMQSCLVPVRPTYPTYLPACTYHGHRKDEPCPTASKKRKRDE
jgi:hypothetical protein